MTESPATCRTVTFWELARAVREAELRSRIWASPDAGPEDLLGWEEEPILTPLVLDVRERELFTAGHLRGAWNLPGRIEVTPQGGTSIVTGEVRAQPRGWRGLREVRHLRDVRTLQERPVLRQWSATLPPPGAHISLWVHCADGSQSREAAVVLAKAGYQVAWVNDDLEGSVAQGVVRMTSSF